jgi:hypothetical protein
MKRIKEITIAQPAYGPAIVCFRDEIDTGYGLTGRRYHPSFAALEWLRRAARKMEVDINFKSGLTTLRPRN